MKLTKCTVKANYNKYSVDKVFNDYLKIQNIIKNVVGPVETWSNELRQCVNTIRTEMCAKVLYDGQQNEENTSQEIHQ